MVSAISDYGIRQYPTVLDWDINTNWTYDPKLTPNEIDDLRKLLKLINEAKLFDKETNQPHCEAEGNKEFITKLVELLSAYEIKMKGK